MNFPNLQFNLKFEFLFNYIKISNYLFNEFLIENNNEINLLFDENINFIIYEIIHLSIIKPFLINKIIKIIEKIYKIINNKENFLNLILKKSIYKIPLLIYK